MSDKTAVAQRLEDKYAVEDGQIYLSGLQALVRLPMDQRRRDERNGRNTSAFISGYEGSPLAGYDLELQRRGSRLDELGIVFTPGLNEELAATAVVGSQMVGNVAGRTVDGVAGYWFGKAPGLDRAADALRHANLAGTSPEGGALALVGDDSVAKSSTVPSASEMALAELGMPVLVPSDAQDVLDFGIHGMAMSRFSGLWVSLKIATNVADGHSTAAVGLDTPRVVVPGNIVDGKPYVHEPSLMLGQPYLAALERSMVHQRLELAGRYARANRLNRVYDASAARVGIVAAGSTYLDLRQALDSLGLAPAEAEAAGLRILRLGMVWPLDPEEIAAFSEGLDEIIVVEEKRPFIEAGIRNILYGRNGAPVVVGKTDINGSELFRADNDLGADRIATGLRRRLASHYDLPEPVATPGRSLLGRPLALLPRTPYFCSGCPHNRSTQVPDGSLVSAGIGCHGMVGLVASGQVGDVMGLTQMGGEGASWIGLSPFVETPHMFQNIGDGTFHHSGSLAVRAAVASGVNITYKLLYNSAVAMTGGQDAVGGMSVAKVSQALLAEGVAKVVITTDDVRRYRRARLPRGVAVHDRGDLVEVQRELADTPGVTVLIHDQECAAELRRKRKRGKAVEPAQRAFINGRVCEGCGDCGQKSNCLSVQPVETEFGRKTQIHQPSCNKDFSCLDGDCPSFLTVVPGEKVARGRRDAPPIDAAALPEPAQVVDPNRFSVRITGVGGTGVVTMAQVVATAAARSGFEVRALDQTGLSQKGGAVVSDLKVTREPIELAAKVGAGECDLYLGCDVLVAASEDNLGTASPERTVAVVSTAEVPTGAMVADTTVHFPAARDTLGRIGDRTRKDAGRFVDAREATLDLFGDDQYANMFLVGVALQLGALPVPADQIEATIALNGVAVERNTQAFRRGRQLIADPDSFCAALRNGGTVDANDTAEAPEAGLEDIVRLRIAELTAYHNAAYADRYASVVERVRAAEERVAGAQATTLTVEVARHLFKLMAYKDEYEVARLSVRPGLVTELEEQFGPGASYRYRLHPPVLRALGMKKKISLGPWFRIVFRALYRMRRVRGTRFDVFGYAKVRRTERALVGEYTALVEQLLERLDENNVDAVAEVAALPDMVRGYEEVKMRNVELYRAEVARKLAGLDSSGRIASPAGG
ncbi:indolepyruvate ferredoxin oxidoreductase [Actinomadura madurae]|uniref:Indolepyruvate ferredoxin oxidoreductase n=1 Tax=Actinomadura madurae TaxID=1993 RepID=A0A1I5I5L3_9ACTN|nr:indolepyruvate ferredoxin oxidoreductase family protein [Actinomadura madurae]SFO55862.1 indolepyruvate ferredoxin oxidoreductase [Actinomadura madurae]